MMATGARLRAGLPGDGSQIWPLSPPNRADPRSAAVVADAPPQQEMVAVNGTGQPQLVVDEHKTILEEVPREENGTLSAANYAGYRPQIMVQRRRRLTFHWQRADHLGRTYKMSSVYAPTTHRCGSTLSICMSL
ncbi:Electron transfer flavoprotein subunit alpha mitochondrial [Zea mays]|nr:Electron transfer flavoprotein subunit alpha mitochondrial [Zea mays]